MSNIGYGQAPGAAGELIQGQFPSGKNFLISLPIEMWSKSHFNLKPDCENIVINQPNKNKVNRAVQLLLALLGETNICGTLEIETTIPVGKGMASSTADITAACRAVGNALGYEITPDCIASLTKLIEPSDGIMFPGLVCFDHIQCELIETLGYPPPMKILILDFGEIVDTLSFNKLPKNYTFNELETLQKAYQLTKTGIQTQNSALLGKAGLISARVNQRLHYKPELENIITLIMDMGGLGLCIGHSGTVINALFDPDADTIQAEKTLRSHYPKDINIYHTTVITQNKIFKGKYES
ncbi:MAG: hypothetical protein JEZ06_12640 [Anaerolineaceae bacterium]|nr:hypothetical protein [Anaerolineaceae bacterium]